MAQFYLNNKPITQGLAVHHLANAMPHLEFKRVRDLVDFARMGYKTAIKQVADYGISIEGV